MPDSPLSRIELIESWFRNHDDGEFCLLPWDVLSSRGGDFANARTVLYTTKGHVLATIKGLPFLDPPIATIGRNGLPSPDDLPLLKRSQRRMFIGDADPPDIMIFAWLREHIPIVWHGVSDAFLEHHGNRDNHSIRIPLSDSEAESYKHMTILCPDYRELLGPYCSSLLDDGFKIELEGAATESRFS